VSDVGDVHNARNVIARIAQILLQHVLHDIGTQVTNMRIVIYGRSAGIDADLAGLVGYEFFSFMGK
jgi:hypothetical protein